MDNNRTSIIIIGVLAIAFVIAIFERLQKPLPQMGDSTTTGSIVSLIILGTFAAMMGAYFFNRGQDRPTLIRNMLIWGGIILAVALVAAGLTTPGLFGRDTGMTL
jgi:membrane associated rhomboid family serine protease